jgi:ABC-type Fe3+/spermidine/putrescine transport system ATPase subunit
VSAVSAVGVTHRYGNDVIALHDVSLDVERGEFLTLLGPSGCGKTTLLRIIGGFERPTNGRVVLAGRDVTTVPAHRRKVNMVFQRPMLFPHLTVAGNVAFGLRLQRLARAEMTTRVSEALELVRLGGYESRRSGELSGGQMQRVALARAIVMRPEVLLLDEPLSALDLKIRLEMEAELRRVHRELGATFVYVTHDQREALALSDRIAVMNEGRVEQLGHPLDVYNRPTTVFAARFVGDANVIPVAVSRVVGGRARVKCAGATLDVDGDAAGPGPGWLVVKPEAVRVAAAPSDAGLRGTIEDAAFRGTGFSYRIAVSGLDGGVRAEVGAEGRAPLAIGTEVGVSWEASASRLLTREGEGT